MTIVASLARAQVEPQNGWLWLVVLTVIVILCGFAAIGFLRYRPPPDEDRRSPGPPVA